MKNFGFIMDSFIQLVKDEIIDIHKNFNIYSEWMLKNIVDNYISEHHIPLYFDIRDKMHSGKIDINDQHALLHHIKEFYKNEVRYSVIYNENMKLKKYIDNSKKNVINQGRTLPSSK